MLVDGLRVGECDETEEEFDLPSVIENADSADPEFIQNQPDIDDLAATAELESLENQNTVPYISMDPKNPLAKMVHKSSVLRLLSNPLTFTESCDWLKCVWGYSQYNESTSFGVGDPPIQEEDNSLYLQDPAVTVVQCDNHVYLAVFQILGIQCDGKDVQSLPPLYLVEPNIHIQGQVMKLGLIGP